ncbi:biosynthetic peptidoglycan transglycosylase [Amnibacterium sp.]|uniref:biosynthetic peptidoglycan transglycosylase n=1 Tax=Amnibacterium sp. TaxID=1872496 RepID=UPI0026362C6A|nr:biosynthetic peptidoglycan transglycosylase [Amnibacterium sp.]MCU1473287.1 putative Transglycosylase [Amnibacterium sp.]
MSTVRADVAPGRRNAASPLAERRRRARRRRRGTRAIAGLVLCVVVIAALAWAGLELVVPSAADAEARTAQLAASRGVVQFSDPTPPKVADALIATEDAQFRTNIGIDPAGVLRWARGTVTGASGDTGGATIEQQLAKMLYTGGRRQPVDQLEQVGLALKLDTDFSKAQILRMYLDTAYFGHGYYGLAAASEGYFGTSPEHLDWQQAALLAGLVQAPSAYDPTAHPALALSRRAHVLSRLAATGSLTPEQASRLAATPLGLR